MLKNRTPMKRTAFKRPELAHTVPEDREQRLADRAARAAVSAMATAALVPPSSLGPCSAAPAPAIEKDPALRSEPYRRYVASLPCCICGVPGYSQAAHANTGKGMGLKACDTTLFPVCADRPGVRGCHSQLDQGALFTKPVRRELEPTWAADTQRRAKAAGAWPKGWPP
jgi:hypothetical protein